MSGDGRTGGTGPAAGSPRPEFSRPLPLAAVPAAGRTETLAATPDECRALAARLALPAVRRLDARLELRPEPGGAVRVRGRLRAAVVQSCVVSLEPVPQEIDEPVDWRVPPPGLSAEEAFGEVEAEGPDDVEAEDGVLDLGEALAQQLSLALDPYPRAPGARLDPRDAGEPDRGPFGALLPLRRAD